MIDHKLQEYFNVLATLYGNGAYLDKILASHLTSKEKQRVQEHANHRIAYEVKSQAHQKLKDSERRTTSRLIRKIDGIVLSRPVSTRAARPIARAQEVYANLAAGNLAAMTQEYLLAKHKFLAVLRLAVLPELYEVRLLALRQLIAISAKQSNTPEYNKFQEELKRSLAVYEIVRSLDDQFNAIMLLHTKRNKRHERAIIVAKEAMLSLQQVNVSSTDPTVIVAGCSLAVVVSQVLEQSEIAQSWLFAFPAACKKLRIWNSAYEIDWLLYQILLGEFLGSTGSFDSRVHRLLQLIRPGTSKWFNICRYLCEVCLRNKNYSLAATIATDVLAHPRFRKQTAFLQRAIIHRALYAATYADRLDLIQLCMRRRIGRNESSLHTALFSLLETPRVFNVMNALAACRQTLDFLKVTRTLHRVRLRNEIFKTEKALKSLDFVADVDAQRKQYRAIHQQLRDALHPLVLDLL